MTASEVRERPGPSLRACDKSSGETKGSAQARTPARQSACFWSLSSLPGVSPLQERTVYKLDLAAAH